MESQQNNLMKALFTIDWREVEKREKVDQDKDQCKEHKIDQD